jgi:hypothetical protein
MHRIKSTRYISVVVVTSKSTTCVRCSRWLAMNDSHSSPLPGLIAPRSFSLLFELYPVRPLTFELYLVPVHAHIVSLELLPPISISLSLSPLRPGISVLLLASNPLIWYTGNHLNPTSHILSTCVTPSYSCSTIILPHWDSALSAPLTPGSLVPTLVSSQTCPCHPTLSLFFPLLLFYWYPSYLAQSAPKALILLTLSSVSLSLRYCCDLGLQSSGELKLSPRVWKHVRMPCSSCYRLIHY